MAQRDYIIANLSSAWKTFYMINYLFDRIVTEANQFSDLELFEPQRDFCILSNRPRKKDVTFMQYDGNFITLISDNLRNIRRSKKHLVGLLNGVPLVEI